LKDTSQEARNAASTVLRYTYVGVSTWAVRFRSSRYSQNLQRTREDDALENLLGQIRPEMGEEDVLKTILGSRGLAPERRQTIADIQNQFSVREDVKKRKIRQKQNMVQKACARLLLMRELRPSNSSIASRFLRSRSGSRTLR
jgi:hypothetical protein